MSDEDREEPTGPKIDEEQGNILDRLADAYEDSRKRAKNNATMNETIRRAFGKGGDK